jgi:hypothetical protein
MKQNHAMLAMKAQQSNFFGILNCAFLPHFDRSMLFLF